MNITSRITVKRWRLLLAILTVAAMLGEQSIRVVSAADGDLDSSFDGDGKVTTPLSIEYDAGNAVAIQSDGRIVVAGDATNTGSDIDFALVRYNADGSLDNSFGVMGRVTTDFANDLDNASDMVIQSDGRIVVAGDANNSGGNRDFAVARYTADGSLDSTFGAGGKVTTDFALSFDLGNAMAIQSDGRIIVAGRVGDVASGDFGLVRYTAAGVLDTTFGIGGRVTTDFANGVDVATAVAVQSDGRIVAAGGASNSGTGADFALARYTAAGSLDPSFGIGGKITTDFANDIDQVTDLVIKNDGRIIVTGLSIDADGNRDFALARYTVDGSLDASFGAGGRVATPFAGQDSSPNAVALQADGWIVVAGFVFDGITSNFALARYNPNGVLDASFGSGGQVITDFGNLRDQVFALAIQPDGKIIAAGFAESAGQFLDFALARYEGAPPPHTLTFYLHGADIDGTAGGFTMTQTPPPPQTLTLNLLSSPSWFSEPPLNGTFQSNATFRLVIPCSVGLSAARSFRLLASNPDGSNEQLLGETTQGLALCVQQQTISIPVTAPVTLIDQRLKLTISSAISLNANLRIGQSTFLQATNFAGTP